MSPCGILLVTADDISTRPCLDCLSSANDQYPVMLASNISNTASMYFLSFINRFPETTKFEVSFCRFAALHG